MSEKYALIIAEKADPESSYPTAGMCTWLGVSRSEFYEWPTATPSAAARRRSTSPLRSTRWANTAAGNGLAFGTTFGSSKLTETRLKS